MKEDMKRAWQTLQKKAPLVQCITNFVTVNDCANIILAAGGSPAMTMAAAEVEEAVRGAAALVCNIGTIESVEAMRLAGKEANRHGIPVVLDPVAVGGTQLRRDAAKLLLQEVQFAAIRGNASEIRHLAGQNAAGSGVDVGEADAVTAENLPQAMEMVRRLAAETGSVIALSGALDIISDGKQTALLENGCPMMSRITGSGCMLTALIGAFCGALPQEPFLATCTAIAAMGIAGESAEELRLQKGTGNATFRTDLIDHIFLLTEETIAKRVHITIKTY